MTKEKNTQKNANTYYKADKLLPRSTQPGHPIMVKCQCQAV